MRKYIVFFLTSAKQRLAYRVQLLLELLTNATVFGATVFLWSRVLLDRGELFGYSQSMLIRYFLFAVFAGMLFSFEPCFGLGNGIQSGMLSIDLLRPVNYFFVGLAKQFGHKIFYLAIIVPIVLILSPYHVLALLYMLSAFLMFYAFMSLLSLIGFYLENTWPLRPILSALFLLLSGKLFPLDILPHSIYQFLIYNPFALVGYVFSKMIMGVFELHTVALFTGVNLLYFAAFYVLYQSGFRKFYHKYEGVRA